MGQIKFFRDLIYDLRKHNLRPVKIKMPPFQYDGLCREISEQMSTVLDETGGINQFIGVEIEPSNQMEILFK